MFDEKEIEYGNKGIFNPCRICKNKYQEGMTACYCTKGFIRIWFENIKNKFKRR